MNDRETFHTLKSQTFVTLTVFQKQPYQSNMTLITQTGI